MTLILKFIYTTIEHRIRMALNENDKTFAILKLLGKNFQKIYSGDGFTG
jgi:hypothetical protein